MRHLLPGLKALKLLKVGLLQKVSIMEEENIKNSDCNARGNLQNNTRVQTIRLTNAGHQPKNVLNYTQ